MPVLLRRATSVCCVLHPLECDVGAGVMSIMFLYYSEEQTVKGSEVQAHTLDTNLISTGEFGMKFPSVQEHMSTTCQDEFFKVCI